MISCCGGMGREGYDTSELEMQAERVMKGKRQEPGTMILIGLGMKLFTFVNCLPTSLPPPMASMVVSYGPRGSYIQ